MNRFQRLLFCDHLGLDGLYLGRPSGRLHHGLVLSVVEQHWRSLQDDSSRQLQNTRHLGGRLDLEDLWWEEAVDLEAALVELDCRPVSVTASGWTNQSYLRP